MCDDFRGRRWRVLKETDPVIFITDDEQGRGYDQNQKEQQRPFISGRYII